MRKFEFNTLGRTLRGIEVIKPFVDGIRKINKTNKAEYRRLNYFLQANKLDQAMPIIKKYGLEKAFTNIRTLLDQIHSDAKGVDYQLGYLENYFPRILKDTEGYLRVIRGTDAFDVFKELIDKKNTERVSKGKSKLSKEEEITLINNAIRGYNPGIALSKISNFKERLQKSLPPQFSKYYEDSGNALIEYVTRSAEAIESRKFFGKGDELGESIGAYIDKLKLTPDQAKMATELFKSRFNQRSNELVSKYKNIVYMTTIGNQISAIKNLSDVPIALYESGSLYKTGKALIKSLVDKSKLKLKDVNIDDVLSAEIEEKGKLATATHQVLKKSGFAYLDRVGKETYLNSVYDSYKKMAKNNPEKLKSQLKDYLSESEANQVINDFKSGKLTTLSKLTMFNKIADVQPITLSELPKKYLDAPVGRLLYTMKSYQLKRLDYFRSQTERMIRNPETRVQGIKNLLVLGGLIGLGEASTDQLVNWVLGRDKSFNESILDGMLQIVGFNKYDANTIASGNIGDLIKDKTTVITTPFDYIGKDVSAIAEDKEFGGESFKLVPVVGKVAQPYLFPKD